MTTSNDAGPILLIPVHDDWEALLLLLPQLDEALSNRGTRARVVLVDDGSNLPAPVQLDRLAFRSITSVHVLELSRNLGHQRAIAVGLCHVHEHLRFDTLAVLDGDGEDDPRDLPRLLDRLEIAKSQTCVFAERTRRSEGMAFRFFYGLYRVLHRFLTGIPVRIGNFSVLPTRMVGRLVTVSDLWNHYAASVVKSGLPIQTVPTKRMPRLAGRSGMNFVSLVAHGLSAMSVFSDRIGVRLLIAAGTLSVFVFALLVASVIIRVATPLAIPGWATTAVGLLCVLLTQLLVLILVFVFMILAGRESSSFLPIRDYAYFVLRFRTACPENSQATTAMREASSTSSP